MKKLFILSVLALTLAGINAGAQGFGETKDKNVDLKLGLAAGGGVSMLSPTSSTSTALSPGFSFGAGVVFNMRFLKRNEWSNAETGVLAFQPEVRYMSNSAKCGSEKVGMGYVAFPIMFQVYPAKVFYIEVGATPALNISHSASKLTYGSTSYPLDKLKANDVFPTFGLGLRFGSFGVGVRYYMGASKIASNVPLKTSSIQLDLSYAFKLKKNVETISF